jgi:regulator of protease activity HflC (stomatin/prohibitin superfamily)
MSVGAITGMVAGTVAIVLLLVGLSGLRDVYQYERVVIFVLGRLIGAKGPGVFWVPPVISRTRKIDLRVVTIELPPPGRSES